MWSVAPTGERTLGMSNQLQWFQNDKPIVNIFVLYCISSKDELH